MNYTEILNIILGSTTASLFIMVLKLKKDLRNHIFQSRRDLQGFIKIQEGILKILNK